MTSTLTRAPGFSLRDAAGALHTLEDYWQAPLVLVFAGSRFGWKGQRLIRAFQELGESLELYRAGLLLVVTDPPEALAPRGGVCVVSDPLLRAALAYRVVPLESRAGDFVPSAFLIDRQGFVAGTWRYLSALDHPGRILEALALLSPAESGEEPGA